MVGPDGLETRRLMFRLREKAERADLVFLIANIIVAGVGRANVGQMEDQLGVLR